MSRSYVAHRTASRSNYNNFCKKYPSISLSFDEWKTIIYGFNESFKEYLLETGDKARFPYGVGEMAINKKKRKPIVTFNGKDRVNLPVDWKKTKAKGKVIYLMNHHTDGYFFGWKWFRQTSRLKFPDLWWFKPTRTTSRLLSHYLSIDEKYKDLYKQWEKPKLLI